MISTQSNDVKEMGEADQRNPGSLTYFNVEQSEGVQVPQGPNDNNHRQSRADLQLAYFSLYTAGSVSPPFVQQTRFMTTDGEAVCKSLAKRKMSIISREAGPYSKRTNRRELIKRRIVIITCHN